MKSIYFVKHDDGMSLTILDLTDYYGIGKVITRVNVPAKFRRQGFGTKVLAQCLYDADVERVNLYLEIQPSDGLEYNDLREWYSRVGFTPWKGIFRRKPKEIGK